MIFDWATVVPGLLSTDIPGLDTPQSSCPGDFVDLKSLNASISTGFSIIRVCHQWRALALPILYRCVIVDSGKAGQSLSRTLLASKDGSETPLHTPLGARVRHLVLSLSVASELMTAGSGLVPWEFQHLAEIAACLPSLTILSVTINLSSYVACTPYYGAAFSRALSATCGGSLRKLHLAGASEVLFAPGTHRDLLNAFPRLRIAIGDGAGGCPAAWPALPELGFITVTTALGACHDYAHSGAALPALRCALFRACSPYHPLESWIHFLELHGPRLEVVYLDLRTSMHKVCVCVGVMKAYCPNLKQLKVFVKEVEEGTLVNGLPCGGAKLSVSADLPVPDQGRDDLVSESNHAKAATDNV
ncbi:hypothetical protein DENSPDRAFT_854498 [Dentipellis sp. KUC8613]|nr:hypothetical protein DENSPDRAFT_854498 [Dentipellis sp. KUC8613]